VILLHRRCAVSSPSVLDASLQPSAPRLSYMVTIEEPISTVIPNRLRLPMNNSCQYTTLRYLCWRLSHHRPGSIIHICFFVVRQLGASPRDSGLGEERGRFIHSSLFFFLFVATTARRRMAYVLHCIVLLCRPNND
jgi:hypothetical protein